MVGTGFSCMCDGSNNAEKSKNKNERQLAHDLNNTPSIARCICT